MATKNKGVEKAKSTAIAPAQGALPQHMRGMAGVGTEMIKPEDLEIARVILLQALSPQVQEGDLKAGTFFHTVAEQDMGREVKIIPVYTDTSFILWKPRNMGGGILARAADGVHWDPAEGEFEVTPDKSKSKVRWKLAKTVAASGLAEWGSSNPNDPQSPPAATRMYNIAVMLPDFPELSPAVITLQRSAIKVARKFLGKLRISQAPTFGQVFTMGSFKDSAAEGEFHNFKFTAAGYVEDPAEFEAAKGFYEVFKAQGLRIRDIGSLQEDSTPVEHAAVD